MAILIMDIMVISNHINYLSWINKESYISIRHYITCIYQIPGFWGSTTFKLNFQSPPGDLSMHSCRMAKNWNSKTNQTNVSEVSKTLNIYGYLWIQSNKEYLAKKHFFFLKKKHDYIYIHTYIHTSIHTCMHACITLHYIPYHTIPHHTTPYHTTPHHTIPYIHTYITYIHNDMYIYIHIYIYT